MLAGHFVMTMVADEVGNRHLGKRWPDPGGQDQSS
jgi:hypothetical protein